MTRLTRSNQELIKYNIIRKTSGCGCSCASNTTRYSIPKRLDDKILDFIQPLGKPCLDFNKSYLLKIENADYSITGLKGGDYISFYKKKDGAEKYLDILENIIILYVTQP